MDRARLAYEAYRNAIGYDSLMMFQLDEREQAAWQAVADSLDAANEDTARLDHLQAMVRDLDNVWLRLEGDEELRDQIDAARKGE
jgi:hypothetical protein